jgi:hypothetical protein
MFNFYFFDQNPKKKADTRELFNRIAAELYEPFTLAIPRKHLLYYHYARKQGTTRPI